MFSVAVHVHLIAWLLSASTVCRASEYPDVVVGGGFVSCHGFDGLVSQTSMPRDGVSVGTSRRAWQTHRDIALLQPRVLNNDIRYTGGVFLMGSDVTTGSTWRVMLDGQLSQLAMTPTGLELSGPGVSVAWPWEELGSLTFSDGLQLLVAVGGRAFELRFISGSEMRHCRQKVQDAVPTRDADPAPPLMPDSALAVELFTISEIPGRPVLQWLGLVSASRTMSRNALSDLGTDMKSWFDGGNLQAMDQAVGLAFGQAQVELKRSVMNLGGNAAVGVQVAYGSPTEKAPSVLLAGTAVVIGH